MSKRQTVREWVIRLLLVASSTLFSLYAIEILSGFLLPSTQEGQGIVAAKRLGYERLGYRVDERDMSEFIADAQTNGQRIVPAFSPAAFLNEFLRQDDAARSLPPLFPLSGIANMPTAGFNESGYRPVYNSDRFGFNNPDSIYQSPIDIALIGDSYTAGITVRADENIAAHLRSADYNVLNLGANANGPLIELGTLIEYAQPQQPPIVVWLFYEGNDLFDLGRERSHPMLIAYLNQDGSQAGAQTGQASYSQNLRDRQPTIDAQVQRKIEALAAEKKAEQAAEDAQRAERNSIREQLTKRLTLTRIRTAIKAQLAPTPADKIYIDSDENLALFSDVLARANRLVSSWDGELYFVYLPVYERFSANQLTRSKLEARREAVLGKVDALQIPYIDMAARFEQEDDPLELFPFGFFGHYDADGYKIVGEEILQALPSAK